MSARYLIRLDDACPTMNHDRWAACEAIFDSLGIKPLVAVVPDNRDPQLQVNQPDPCFWDRVRAWQQKGWTIAMHGYQHQFHYVDRRKLILPFYDRSEFAGLSFLEQSEKIRAAWQIFERAQVTPTVWIAPAHSFDRTTLQAIERETPIRIISDGIARNQYYEDGFYWLPQQLWSFKEKSSGLWTICVHPNSMNTSQIENLESWLELNNGKIHDIGASLSKNKKDLTDLIYEFFFWKRSMVSRWIDNMINVQTALLIRSITSKAPRIKGLGILLGWIARKFRRCDFTIKVKALGSHMILSPNDDISRQLIFVPQWYDSKEIKICKTILNPGDYAVDVGANIGAYTLLFCRIVGNNGLVTAIEADSETFQKLVKNININNYSNCNPINLGVSDKQEILTFYKNNTGNAGANSFLKSERQNEAIAEKIHLAPLHLLIEKRKIKLLKLDIEGFELRVLREYLSMIPKLEWAAHIMLEDEPKHREGDAVEFLKNQGYEIMCRVDTNVFMKLK